MQVTAFSDLLRTEDAIDLSHLERLRTHFERAGGTLNFRQFEAALARVLGEDASSDLYHRKVSRTAGCLLDGRKVTIFIHDWLPFAAEACKLLSIYSWLPVFKLKCACPRFLASRTIPESFWAIFRHLCVAVAFSSWVSCTVPVCHIWPTRDTFYFVCHPHAIYKVQRFRHLLSDAVRQADTLFKKMDANNNGDVDWDEFCSYMMKDVSFLPYTLPSV